MSSSIMISVIVSVFNQEKYIGRCLRSLLNQTLNKDIYEIIVVNDGSKDKSAYALDLFSDPNNNLVKIIDHNKNLGLPAALNTGINSSEGKYIVRVDADDYVNKNFLSFLYNYLNQNEDADAVSCDYLLVDDKEKIISRFYADKDPIGCGIMFKKELLINIGLYDTEFRFNEEKELRMRFEMKYKIENLKIPLYRYRRHENNITNDILIQNKYDEKLKIKYAQSDYKRDYSEENIGAFNQIKLGKRIVNKFSEPYIIAEIGVNHEGSLENAKRLIELAKEGGADAAKFQSYKASKIASKNSPSYWDLSKETTKSQYELFKKYDNFNEKDYIKLAEHCKKIDIDFLSTPFDHDAIDFLDELVPFYKIASADITNFPFLEKIALKNKPVVLSTGASNIEEISNAVDIISKNNKYKVILLHCILNYPTKNKNANLRMISHLIDSFEDHLIGYSDHTLPDSNMDTLLISYLLGAVVIEKHFTFDKTLPGNDHYHAMDINDLKFFKKRINLFQKFLGKANKKHPLDSEDIARMNARRSLVLTSNLKKDHVLKSNDLICKRPGTGISPIYFNKVIGKTLNYKLSEDHILKWSDLKEYN